VPVLKSFAGGRLFGGTWGSGVPTVLALHGWQRTHADFAPAFEGSGPSGTTGSDTGGIDAVALDLFGFGATPPPPEPWGSADYARHLLPLFEEPGVLADRIVLVGHSFGGRIAPYLAGLVPDRIERMVLCGAPLLHRHGRRSKPAPAFRVARRLHALGLLGEERMEVMRNRYGSPDYRASAGVMRAVFVRLLAEEYGEAMAAVRCPVELLWGEDDTEVPVEVAQRARPLFAAADLVTLPGIGHLLPMEAPAQLRQAVLGRHSPDPGTPPAAAENDPAAGPR
jgi:pimeloyl-ACP methyl ester carboxylesterase